MSKTLNAKTKEYIETLRESDEVKSYKTALETFRADNDAKALLKNLQEAQQTYAIFRQGGFEGLAEQEKKVRALQGQMSKNKKIQDLLKAQENLQSLVGNLADEISQGINVPFTQPQREGCCG